MTTSARTGAMETVGVIGGMGPAATTYYIDQLVTQTPAERDQDHLRVVVDSNPNIPDRTRYLLGDGPDPLPALVETARNVEAAGADILSIPCNTAHAFFDEIGRAVDLPVLDMVQIGIDAAVSTGADRVGLLATDGTLDLGLYHDAAAPRSIEIVPPEEPMQERVMAAIYNVKNGERKGPRRRLVEAVNTFDDVDAVIAGCTEIPLALGPGDIPVPLVDPMTAMANVAIARVRDDTAGPRA